MKRQNTRFATLCASLCIGTLTASVAFADIAVRFDEGAPKDRFSFENVGSCTIGSSELTLDISGSASGLIFDTTGKGAGVEVYQPLEIVAGSASLTAVTPVADGDKTITLSIRELQPGDTIAFTIDVDDTAGQREITVSGSEIEGTALVHKADGRTSSALISSNARALIETGSC
ncbi:aggregation factor core [uncultured Roseibium sp.]|uniref:aggregation factor core n=1 Tax=uncultured Roseibium sp. TaxID=1936171 RepID=UPI0026210D26|nr:aggregation factor core [uncultured Roseibium sp.]